MGAMISDEEFFKELEETVKHLAEQPVEIYGSKTKPYYFCCSNDIYKKIKELLPLDENDMYCNYGVWVKVINVDNAFGKIEAKPYEVKDIPFCNIFKKPFYQDVFKPSKEKYSIKTVMKGNKRK